MLQVDAVDSYYGEAMGPLCIVLFGPLHLNMVILVTPKYNVESLLLCIF